MTDRLILFSAPMVRALLDGRKTQTRRALNPQPYPLEGRPGYWNASGVVGGRICISDRALLDLHHKPTDGDRLWVREAHYLTDDGDYEQAVCAVDADAVAEHLATVERLEVSHPTVDWSRHKRLRPGIHMPRWASRLTLTVTDVRVQRLQEISEADARAEGVPSTTVMSLRDYDHGCVLAAFADSDLVFAEEEFERGGMDGGFDRSARKIFSHIWDRINAARGFGWNTNPFVVAVSFTVQRHNIDQVPA